MRRVGRKIVVGASSILCLWACGETLGGINTTPGGSDATAETEPPRADGDAVTHDGPSPGEPLPANDFCFGVDASFCWSFDQPSTGVDPLLANGALVFTGSQATSMTLVDAGRSAPNSVSFLHPEVVGDQSRTLDFALMSRKSARCTIAFVVDRIPMLLGVNETVDIVKFDIPNGPSPKLSLRKVNGDLVTVFLKNDRTATNLQLASVTRDTWIDLTLSFALNGMTATFEGKVEGQSTQDASTQTDAGAIKSFQFGIMAGKYDWGVRFDDVRCSY